MRKVAFASLLLAGCSLLADDSPRIEMLTWMAGSWADSDTEEWWTTPKGGLMLGMNRSVQRGKTGFEFLRIAETPEGITYFGSPGGRPPTPFRLRQLERQRVVFENLEHDFPQRIIYWTKGASLCARVEGTIQGKTEGEEWCWNRVQ